MHLFSSKIVKLSLGFTYNGKLDSLVSGENMNVT